MSGSLPFELVAHRGNAQAYPENTLPAFASALALGVRCLELDVHLSADRVPMVIHDHDLLRTTGRRGSVFALTGDELAALSAHEPQRLGSRFEHTPIPRLSEVLTLLEDRPEVTLFVEIKRASLAHFGHEEVVGRIVQLLRPAHVQCVVISFDRRAVELARELSGLAIGWVLSACDEPARLACERLQPQFLFADHEQLPSTGALWRGPWRWALYEVETLPLALALAARGAQYIETMAVQPMCAAMRAFRPGAGLPPDTP